MPTKYKVWIEIEQIDEDEDIYENIGEPQDIATFDSFEEAEAYVSEVFRRMYQ